MSVNRHEVAHTQWTSCVGSVYTLRKVSYLYLDELLLDELLEELLLDELEDELDDELDEDELLLELLELLDDDDDELGR